MSHTALSGNVKHTEIDKSTAVSHSVTQCIYSIVCTKVSIVSAFTHAVEETDFSIHIS